MNVEDALVAALDAAQNELAEAEVALLEAKARAEAARTAASRLKAAKAALDGAPITTSEAQPAEQRTPNPQGEGSTPSRRAKPEDNNPLAHLKCKGCGKVGSLSEQYMTAPSGALVRMLVCGSCKNQNIMM